jgi:chromosome segregation protein
LQFTRLRVLGFKSFVEPTELAIEPGLTGVVGPNGCGKSNLVEALRWVMGESSHKNMRASGMDDVIFQGSLNRPSRNTAEVSLALDNTDRSAPSPHNDSELIEVTRRIEREAGSVYRINGRDVRARDVQLLFADASTGAHSPAIVGQGKIGELIAAKPTDRRALLEEAAGIAGLHNRRHEAELRLRAAEQNLARIDDVIAEITQQFDALKRQARQATRYRNLSGEIRKAEATVLHLRYAAATATLGEAETAMTASAAAATARAAEQATAARVEAEAAAGLPQLREASARAGAALQRLAHAREAIDGEDKRIASRLGELSRLLTQFTEDIAREQRMLADHRAILTRLDAEERDLDAENAAVAERQTAAGARRRSAEAALAESEAAMSALTTEHAELTARRGEHDRAIADAAARSRRLAAEIESVARERAALDAGRADAVGAARTATSDAETVLAAREQEATAAEHRLQSAREAGEAARDALAKAERVLSRIETEAATLATLLASAGVQGALPLIDAVKVDPGFEAALGAAFGDDLDAPADETAPAHWRTVPAHGDAPLPEGAVPLANYVSVPVVLARRLAQTGVVVRTDGPRVQRALRAGQRLVSRDGDLWRWDGYVAQADAPGSAAQRLASRNRLAELETMLGPARDEAATRRTAFSASEAAIAAALAADRTARAALTTARAAIDKARRGLADAERDVARVTAKRSGLDEAFSRLTASRDETTAAEQAAAAALAAAADPAAIAADLAAQRARVEEDRAIAIEARAAAEGIAREADIRSHRLAAIAVERQGWHERTAGAESQIATLTTRRRDAEAEQARLAPEPLRIETQRRALLSEIATAEAARAAASDALARGEAAVAEASRTARTALDALTEARVERGRAEERAASARSRLAELTRHIEEVMQCPPGELLETAQLKEGAPLPDLADLEARLERYREERERLGAVNLRAEAEATELGTRRDTLAREKDDLVAAIERLRHGIASLNREGRERLGAAFLTVKAHFTRLFTHLFGGGTAELMLTDSDDPLLAGLEIVARPPGKKPQIMTLLSGGEQALTAMALIFAVFLTNPAPICVLDEVDAPLDDANVDRFCDLLDEMKRSTATRFLVITHNPITMSRMSRLYGVTMAERGVSQLVSVDLETAERFREAV